MARDFRPYAPEQAFLLPQAPREWLREGHLALFLQDAVSQLDLSTILERYGRGRGPEAYHAQMLLTVLLYGYCVGMFSSRKIAARCETDVAFRVLSAGQYPDFRTMSDFRKQHLADFKRLFLEVLRLCREAGLLRLGHISLDGSKFQANASKHKAMSYRRIQEAEPQLEQEIRDLLKKAKALDEAEDAEFGKDQRGDELPEELRRREGRLEKIREAKRRLEERARTRTGARAEAKGATPGEVAAAKAAAKPSPKEQSNFTDPDSRIMKTKTGWVQGYNAQVLVNEAGIILAEEVSVSHVDSPRLTPMLDQLGANLMAAGLLEEASQPGVFTADAGYCSEANLAELAARQIDAYVATGRERHHRAGIDPRGNPRTPLRTAMRAKLATPEGHAVYARRKVMTEPVFGQEKQARGFRQCLLRGAEQVAAELTLVHLTHNLLKLWRAQAPLPA